MKGSVNGIECESMVVAEASKTPITYLRGWEGSAEFTSTERFDVGDTVNITAWLNDMGQYGGEAVITSVSNSFGDTEGFTTSITFEGAGAFETVKVDEPTPLTIEEFVKRRDELESNIASEVANLINRFYDDTGYSPDSIHIPMIETTIHSSSREEFVLGKVEVSVKL